MENNVTEDELLKKIAELECKRDALKLEAKIAENARNEEVLSFINGIISKNHLESYVSVEARKYSDDNEYVWQIHLDTVECVVEFKDICKIMLFFGNGNECGIRTTYTYNRVIPYDNENYFAYAKFILKLASSKSKVKSLIASIAPYRESISNYLNACYELKDLHDTLDQVKLEKIASAIVPGTWIKFNGYPYRYRYGIIENVRKRYFKFKDNEEMFGSSTIERYDAAKAIDCGDWKIMKRPPKNV